MNIYVDLDNKVVEFVAKETNEKKEIINIYIERIVSSICEEKNIKCENISVSISSADKEEIRKINNEYRNIDRATDVLSFPIFDREEIKDLSIENNLMEIELGDIILFFDVIK